MSSQRHHFALDDDFIADRVGGLRAREQLMAECDVLLLPKPVVEDLEELPVGKTLWGRPHCVQDEQLMQVAVDRRQTLIAWEAVHHWTHDGSFGLHVFHKNNELAGYRSVIHALELMGVTGAYGRRLRAAVTSFGATARGAVTALFAFGVHGVDVLTYRGVAAVAAPMAPARLIHYERDPEHSHRALPLNSFGKRPAAQFLADHDVVVNGILQDTDDPLMFVMNDELDLFKPGSLFIDVSGDEGMGFGWARPTSFAEPMLSVGNGAAYYAVDHSPSYLWRRRTSAKR